jgi:hypothetical protein
MPLVYSARLKASGAWVAQGTPFPAFHASRGICPGGSVPVQRFARDAGGGMKHYRFSARSDAARGAPAWVAEGVAFCAADTD